MHDCDHHSGMHECHFRVEILIQISIDNIFIGNTDNKFQNHISCVEASNTSLFIEFVSEQVPISNYLRGPPQIS